MSGYNYNSFEPADLPAPFGEIDLRAIWNTIWRRKAIIFGATVAVIILAVLWVLSQPVEYTSKAVLQLNSRQAQVLDVESVLSGINIDPNSVKSEIDVIRSSYLAGRVVDKLNLIADPVFNPSLKGESILSKIKAMFAATPSAEDIAKKQRLVAIQELMSRTGAFNPPRSLTINVTARMPNSAKSALIANTVAEEYLQDQLDTRFNATSKANSWINSRLSELRKKVRESEEKVQKFKKDNNLLGQGALTITDQQLSELNTQLILARTSRAEEQAKYRRAKDLIRMGRANSAADVINSPLIQKLREQEAIIQSKQADLATRYGPKHPKMIKANAEVKGLKIKIRKEVNNILGSYENRVAIAKTREYELSKNLKATTTEAGQSSAAEVKLAELEREASANRAIYGSFLNRSKETAQQGNLEQADARLISKAEVPLKPSHPKKKLILIMALIAGLSLGLLIAVVLERLDNSFRTAEQIEKMLGLPVVGQIPLLENQPSPLKYLMSKLTSSYAEAIRTVRTALHFANPDDPAKVVMVTSSMTNEGKSTFALSMGALAAQGGKNVIIVDCDMRRPSIAKMLGLEVKKGIGQVLVENEPFSKVILTHKESGLKVLPSLPDTPNSSELANSKKMQNLIAALKESYDLVILDTPPVTAVADPLNISQLADTTLFLVKWADTARELTIEAVKKLRSTHVHITGVVVTQIDKQQSRYYGYGYSDKASAYYTD